MSETKQSKKTATFYLQEDALNALEEISSLKGQKRSEVLNELIKSAKGQDDENKPMIITVMNHKGGVAKTTTVSNLAMCLAERGNHVLVIDLDSQGNVSQTFNRYDPSATEPNMADVMLSNPTGRRLGLKDVIHQTDYENIQIAPCSLRFSGADTRLRNESGSGIDSRLLFAIEDLLTEVAYEYILIDCPPSIELVTTNAITALEAGNNNSMIIIPMKIDGYAIAGMDNTLAAIQQVARERRTLPRPWKLLRTVCEAQTTTYKEGMKIIREKFKDSQFFNVYISKATAVSESSLLMRPLMVHAPGSRVADDYRMLAEEIEAINE